MEEILYVKIAQNIPVAKRQVTFHDLATLHLSLIHISEPTRP